MLVYRPSLSGNFFRIPHLIAIGYILFGIVIASLLSFSMRRDNLRKEALVRAGLEGEREEGGTGEKSLGYRYQL